MLLPILRRVYTKLSVKEIEIVGFTICAEYESCGAVEDATVARF